WRFPLLLFPSPSGRRWREAPDEGSAKRKSRLAAAPVRRLLGVSGHVVSPYPHPSPSPEGRGAGSDYWQASQASGFSSEQAMASSGVYSFFGASTVVLSTVAFAIFVAGRERR